MDDLRNLENALNNGDFKEQVYCSLEGIYQISKVLNQLDLLKNFNDHDLEIIAKIQAMKNALAGYETSGQELNAQIKALANSLEAKKQELESFLNTQLQNALASEKQKINEAGIEVKNNLVSELTKAKDNLALELKKIKDNTQSLLNTPLVQGINLKFLGVYIYGIQKYFNNESNEFRELFEFTNIHLGANRSYIVQFSMPYELTTYGIYSESMGEMVLCLKANNKVYPIINSFYQNKTSNLHDNKIMDTYRTNCIFKTPSEEADYEIAVFARRHKDLWVNVNYTPNTQGFDISFLNNAKFSNATTQSLPTDYGNDKVFFKRSRALIYEILE